MTGDCYVSHYVKRQAGYPIGTRIRKPTWSERRSCIPFSALYSLSWNIIWVRYVAQSIKCSLTWNGKLQKSQRSGLFSVWMVTSVCVAKIHDSETGEVQKKMQASCAVYGLIALWVWAAFKNEDDFLYLEKYYTVFNHQYLDIVQQCFEKTYYKLHGFQKAKFQYEEELWRPAYNHALDFQFFPRIRAASSWQKKLELVDFVLTRQEC